MRRALTIAIAAASLAACISTAGPPIAADQDPRVERGRGFAERRCAGCHAIGLDETSAPSGPRFRDLRMRSNALSLQRRFAEISAHGAGEMPPIQISPSEAEDLIAYFESLGAR